MRIGIFDPYLDDLGGGEKYMMKIAECLSQKNDVSVFWDGFNDIKSLSERFALDLSRISIVKNIFSPKVNFLKRVIESKKYDAIIFLSDGSIPFVLSGKLFIHIQQPLKIKRNSIKGKIKVSRVTNFFCNSEYTRSFIKEKSVVLYPPVEIKAKNITKENIILHVGRFRVLDALTGAKDYKKQYFMIDVFKKMIKRGLKNWRFILAVSVNKNEGSVFNELRNKALDFPIHFEVNKSNADLWKFYSKAKIYWHASGFGEDLEKHPEYAEHFGISTAEAMGGGAVPVVINAGGQKEIISNNQDGFLWNTEEEFIEKTKELIENESLLLKMSKKAKEKALKFNSEKFCLNLQKIIE